MEIVEVIMCILQLERYFEFTINNSQVSKSLIIFYDSTLGPLTYYDGGRETLVGAVSWGRRTCFGPTVFARVTEALPWIQEKMRQSCQ